MPLVGGLSPLQDWTRGNRYVDLPCVGSVHEEVDADGSSLPPQTFHAWRWLLVVGGWAALGSVALTLLQVWIYLRWPPPDTVEEYFALFDANPLLGLLSLDLLYIVNNTIVLLVYLALYVVLRHGHRSAVTIALLLGSVGMAAYMASNVAFEMWSLAGSYPLADSTGRLALLGAGKALLAVFEGTAFDVYYVFGAVALFLFAGSMLRSREFSRASGAWATAAAVLMIVPSTVGTVGVVFALASLVPWVVFSALVGSRLLRLSAGLQRPEG